MKKRALYPLAVTNVRFTLTFFTQLLVLLFVFNVPAHAQWQKLPNLPAAKVSSIAIDPGQPQNMWAGLAFTQNNTSIAGLYRSQNNGQSWTQVSPTSLQGIPITNKPVRSLSVAPDNSFSSSFILVAFANEGIYRSIDGGNIFTEAQISNPQLPGTFLKQNVSQVVVTKLQGTVRKLYAVVYDGVTSASGLYSASLTVPSQQIVWQKTSVSSINIQKLIVNPNNANILYILTTDSRIMKSNDGGANFIDSNSGLPAGVGAVISDFIIDTTLDSTLYASGFQGGVKGFYKSTNSGISWTVVNPSEIFHRIAIDSVNGLKTLYGIKTESGFNSNQPRYEVYQSQNEGLNWSKLDTSLQSQLTGNTLNTIETYNGSVFVGGDDGLFSFNNAVGGVPNGLSVMATANPMTVQPGGQLSVTLTVTNNTQNILNNITVLGNSLPVGAVMTSFNVPECSLSSTQINCTLNNLAPGVPLTKVLTFTMPSPLGAGSSLTFNASGVSPITGQQLSGTSLPINIGGAGQGTQNGLSLTVTPSPTSVTIGGQVSFTLSLMNLTSVTMPTVNVTAGSFASGTAAGIGSAFECTVSTQINCNFSNLAPNIVFTKTIVVKLPTTAAVPTTPITFNASTPNGLSTASTAPISLSGGVGQQNGLSLTVTPSPTTAVVGGQVSFTLRITNLSNTIMPTVNVTAGGFPSGTFSGIGSAAECNVSTQISCSFSNLAPNVALTKTIIVRLPTGIAVPTTPITFNASTPNGLSTASSTPINLSGTGQGAQNGLSLTVTPSPTSVTIGGQVSFTLSLTNLTNLTMPTVTVTAGSFASGTAAGIGSAPECTVSTQINCNFSNLAPNIVFTKTIVVQLPTTAAVPSTPITFNASTPNGLSTASSTPISLIGDVGQQNGLSLTVTSSPTTAVVGGQVSFTLRITNLTTTTMPTVNVTAGGFPSRTFAGNGSAAECNVSTQISCSFSNLAPNVALTKTIIVRLPTGIAVPTTPITFNASTPNGLSTASSTPINLSGTGQGAQNGLSLTVTPSSTSVTIGSEVSFTLRLTNLTNVSMPTVNVTAGGFSSGTAAGIGSAFECTVATQINCNFSNLAPNVALTKTIVVKLPTTAAVPTTPITFNARNGNGLSTATSAPINLSGTNAGGVNFTVTPATLSVSAGQDITFNLSITNQSQTTLSNVSLSGVNIPTGAQAISLPANCNLNLTEISCQIPTLSVNTPVNLSLSFRMPATLPATLQQIRFTLNAGANAPIVKPVSLTSAAAGSIFANSGTGQATVGTPFVGNFTSSSTSAATVYQLSGQPTNGVFAWNSPSCVNQTSCNSGAFTYTPNSNSGGQTEIIQFTVRANATSTPSPAASYTITIAGSSGTSAGGSLGPWLLIAFLLIFLRNRQRIEV